MEKLRAVNAKEILLVRQMQRPPTSPVMLVLIMFAGAGVQTTTACNMRI